MIALQTFSTVASLRRLEPHADAFGCSAALAHIARITHEGSDASFLRRQHLERGSSEGMVEAAIAAFCGEAAWG